jgi:excisionase family DNA binding protein
LIQGLMSVEQAAERLGGISKWSVYAWLSKGRLRRTKVGSRTMIRESDIQAFLANCNPEVVEQLDRGEPTPALASCTER